MIWQRSRNLAGPWEDIPISRVSAQVLRRYNRRVRCGQDASWVTGFAWYYRVLYCV